MTALRGNELDVALRLLDHQLVGSDEVRCGKVDDVALEPDGGELVVAALLSGPRAQRRRLPAWASRLSRWVGRDVEHRVDWEHVEKIEAAIKLDQPAEALGLGAGDRNARDLIPERIPKS
jgi:sporulation protein YlmC with PRC-barrel domain